MKRKFDELELRYFQQYIPAAQRVSVDVVTHPVSLEEVEYTPWGVMTNGAGILPVVTSRYNSRSQVAEPVKAYQVVIFYLGAPTRQHPGEMEESVLGVYESMDDAIATFLTSEAHFSIMLALDAESDKTAQQYGE
jgi:hypothetical protein